MTTPIVFILLALVGGIAGTLQAHFMGILGFSASRIGLASVLTLFVAPQFIVGAVMDHYGLLGAEVRSLDLSRV